MDLRMLITGPTCVPIGGVNVRLTGTAKNAKDEHVHFIWYKGNKHNGGEKIAEGVGLTSISVEGPKTEDECFIYELHGQINALECAIPYDTHRVCAGDCYPECPPFTSLGRREPKRKNEEVFGKTHQNPIEIFPNMLPSTLQFKGRI